MKRTDIRNVAIIAHVDHGKTTLVDQMMRQSGLFRAEELDSSQGGQHGLILDSNDLERERGITILAKNIALTRRRHQDQHHRHARPRRLRRRGRARPARWPTAACCSSMPPKGRCRRRASCCARPSSAGLRPIVVINKIDRPDARPIECSTRSSTCSSNWTPTTRRSISRRSTPRAGKGIATTDLAIPAVDLRAAVRRHLKHVPPPEVELDAPLQMLVITLDYSDYVGRIAIGRVVAGKIRKNQRIALLKHDGKRVDEHDRAALRLRPPGPDRNRRGRRPATSAPSSAWKSVDIGDTIADIDNPVALPPIKVDEPTLDMVFRINDSPFCGQEGTLRHQPAAARSADEGAGIERRPARRARARTSATSSTSPAAACCTCRILLENMRREGFELSVGKPRVINQGNRRRDDGADRISGRRRADGARRLGDGAGRQSPGGVRQAGHRAAT